MDSKVKELEQYTTRDKVIRSYKLGLKALNEVEKFVQEYDNNIDYVKRDTLLYTSKNSEIDEIRYEYEIRKDNGLEVDFIDSSNNPYSFDLKAGVYSKNAGAEIDPYKFTHELIKRGIENGLRVYENTEVVRVNYSEDSVEVCTTYDYKVKGKIVIVATGYNTKLFTDRNFGVKTTTFNIVTKPLKKLTGFYNNTLTRDNESPYNYLRSTLDNRLIIGGEDINFIPDIKNDRECEEKYNILENRLKAMFKDIKDIEIEYKYCGAFISTQDNLGFIGKDPKKPRLWYNLGYGANGILFAILGGLMLPKIYLGEVPEDLNLFKVDRFDN